MTYCAHFFREFNLEQMVIKSTSNGCSAHLWLYSPSTFPPSYLWPWLCTGYLTRKASGLSKHERILNVQYSYREWRNCNYQFYATLIQFLTHEIQLNNRGLRSRFVVVGDFTHKECLFVNSSERPKGQSVHSLFPNPALVFFTLMCLADLYEFQNPMCPSPQY